jgi:autotransporter-associated beta strand protein
MTNVKRRNPIMGGTPMLLCFLLLAANSLLPVFAADKTWTGAAGDNNWNNAANWNGGLPGTGDKAIIATPGVSVNVTASTQILTLQISTGATGVSVNIASGVVFTLSNSGALVYDGYEDAVINGPGSVRLSTSSSNYADWKPRSGKTLAIHAPIAANGEAGLENNDAGTLLVTSPSSAFTGNVTITGNGGTIAFPSIADSGVESPLGKGSKLTHNQPNAVYRFIGGSSAAANRAIELGHTPLIFEQAGSAALTLSGTVSGTSANGAEKTFVLAGGSDAPAVYAGSIANGASTLSLVKRGAGTWTLSGANSATGALTVEDGTLVLAAQSAFTRVALVNGLLAVAHAGALPAASPLTLTSGTLRLDVPAPALGPATATGFVVFDLSSLVSAATLPAITIAPAGRVNIVSSVPVFISGASAGPLAGILINGAPASYDAASGVIPFNGLSVSVPAQGPYAVASAPGTAYAIDSEGTSGGITLADPVTTVFSLTQQSQWPAAVAFDAGQTFAVDALAIAPAAAALTLGVVPGEGFVTAPSGTLALEVGNPDAALTLYTSAVDPAPGAPLGVVKDGPGEAVLLAPAFTGGVSIHDGTLALLVDGAGTFAPPNVSGAGTLAKDGAGTLLLTNASPSFTGPVTVRAGILKVGASDAAGLSSSNRLVTILPGSALDVGAGSIANGTILRQQFTVAGDGPVGGGALVNTSQTTGQNQAFQKVALSGDASVGGSQRIDLRPTGSDFGWLDLAGHTLSKISANYLAIINVPISEGGINVQGGTLSVEGTASVAGDADNTLDVAPDAILMLYGLVNPIPWTVNLSPGADLRAGNLAGDTLNRINGPVNLTGPGDTRFTVQNADAQLIINGKVSGQGGIAQTGSRGVFKLMNPANDYAGSTTVSNKDVQLHAEYAGALPGWNQGRVTVTNEAVLSVPLADTAAEGWTLSDALELSSNGTFAGTNTTLKVDTSRLSAPVGQWPEALDHGLWKVGTGTLALTAPVTAGYVFLADEGTIDVQSPGPHSVGYSRTYSGNFIFTNATEFIGGANNQLFYLADKANVLSASNRIGGAAHFTITENGYNRPSGKLTVGQNGHAVLDIADDAQVWAPFIVGNSSGSGGAVYQSGDSVVINSAGMGNDGAVGASGYGHYWLESGTFTNKGYTQVGRNSGGTGIFRQTGGTFVQPNHTARTNGVVSPDYNGHLIIARTGSGAALLSGGEFYHERTWNPNNDANYDYTAPGYSVVGIGGDAYVKISGSLDIGCFTNANSVALINFWGDGVLHTRRIYTYAKPSQKYVNFNGGTFRVLGGDGNNQFLFNYTGLSQPTRTTLYGDGATFDVPEDAQGGRTLDIPLSAPAGRGLVSFDLGSPLTGYYAPPFPVLNGHGGTGGFVDTVYDRATGAVTGFRVHSPGWNYPQGDVTVTLKGGGMPDATVALKTAPVVPGGLTKRGSGALTLTSSANTYAGVTRVLEGTLSLGAAGAIPYASPVEIGGAGTDAVLNLNGYTLTNASVTLKDGGMVVNGTLAAATLRKIGTGSAVLATPTTVDASVTVPRPDDALIPGLQEGMIRTAWVDQAMNPGDNVQLTTVAGNGAKASNATYAGGRWNGDNHTWIYTGYAWNRTATNQTWNFRGSFDDNVSFWLDNNTSATLIRTGNGTEITATATLPPGPHLIRVYFGDGSGSVGPNGNSGNRSGGLEVDTGDGAGFRPFTDPGDGSFLTVSQAPWGAFSRAMLDAAGSQPGLWEGTVSHSRNTVDPNPMMSVQQTTRAANGTSTQAAGYPPIGGYQWASDTTVIYSGYIWNHEDHDVTWTFMENFDDTALVKIDGSVVLCDAGAGTQTRANVTLTPGPHLFEARFGERGGTVGCTGSPPAWWGSVRNAFLVDFEGRMSDVISNYAVLSNSVPERPLLTTGPALPGAVTPANALVIEEGTVALGARPGLYEGMIRSSWDAAGVPAPQSIQLTTRAGNISTADKAHNTTGLKTGGIPSDNTTITNFWAGNNHTWVYTGYLWNRTDADVTYYLAASFDDHAQIAIDGQVIIHNNNAAWTATRAAYTLTPGPHAVDIRFSDGSGNVGASQTGLLGGLVYTLDPASTNNASAYMPFADPGDGSLLTTELPPDYSDLSVEIAASGTLDLGGAACNVGSVSGDGSVVNGAFAADSLLRVEIEGETSSCVDFDSVDISNLTVVPADAPSANPPYHTYVIATGSFTGKPALSGFASKYKLQVRGGGSQLVLTSQGATVLLLK